MTGWILFAVTYWLGAVFVRGYLKEHAGVPWWGELLIAAVWGPFAFSVCVWKIAKAATGG